mmetsp:Transcript_23560/g.51707  ORF Transcript_23560/g.51707 Transcript_23560/m.51707 type:complete len:215 (+) Transcript_23560:940-1584(+)
MRAAVELEGRVRPKGSTGPPPGIVPMLTRLLSSVLPPPTTSPLRPAVVSEGTSTSHMALLLLLRGVCPPGSPVLLSCTMRVLRSAAAFLSFCMFMVASCSSSSRFLRSSSFLRASFSLGVSLSYSGSGAASRASCSVRSIMAFFLVMVLAVRSTRRFSSMWYRCTCCCTYGIWKICCSEGRWFWSRTSRALTRLLSPELNISLGMGGKLPRTIW